MLSDPYRPRRAADDGDSHIAPVSSQCSSEVVKNDCVRGFAKQLCHVSSALVMWCGLPPGLIGWITKSELSANAVLVRRQRTESHGDR